mgnify:CR=1 FL=1|jgi:hypothetical protein
MAKSAIIFLFLPFSLMILHSCNKDSDQNLADPLIGTWVFNDYDPELNQYYFSASDTFDPEKQGYTFQENNKAIIRMNAGFCGTPPIVYDNYPGNWHYENDSSLFIESTFWGTQDIEGPFIYIKMEIAYLDGDELIVTIE